MILLLGGTSETAIVAQALAGAGSRVLVSTATDVPLEIGSHPGIQRRQGRLDKAAMVTLISREQITTLVDVTHPYATEVRATAEQAAHETGIPYFTFVRPAGGAEGQDVISVPDHATAAQRACEFKKPILLTIGSRHVADYARVAGKIPLIARVLPHPESLAACRVAGIPENHIITGRGPFTVEENRELIRRFNIGVLVTKDSGDAGGVAAKLEAARLESCHFIVVGRSAATSSHSFSQIEPFIEAILQSPSEGTHHA